jgi:membrane fusion protein (multidrug efflux system)
MPNPTTSTPALGHDAPAEFDFLPDSEIGTDVSHPSDTPPRPAAASAPAPAAAPATPTVRNRGPLFRLAVILIAIAAALWVGSFIHRMLVFEETDDAYIDGHIHQVSSRVAGSVTDVLVDENQPVKAGQVLARIDPLEFDIAAQEARAAVAQAQADVQQARAALVQAQADGAQLQAQEAGAEAKVAQIEAQLSVANVNYGRDQRLFQADAHAVSKSDVDTTQGAAQATTAELAGAKADVAAAQARVQAGQASVQSAEAAVTAALTKVDAQRAALLDAQRNLSYVSILSPSDGRIGNKNVESGNRVQVGQTLFAVVDRDCWITANFKETQLRDIQPGQPVEITVDAIGGRVFDGTVESIAPASGAQFALLPADNATGNFTKVVQRVPIKIVFNPASIRGYEDRLRPGLSTVVSVRVK